MRSIELPLEKCAFKVNRNPDVPLQCVQVCTEPLTTQNSGVQITSLLPPRIVRAEKATPFANLCRQYAESPEKPVFASRVDLRSHNPDMHDSKRKHTCHYGESYACNGLDNPCESRQSGELWNEFRQISETPTASATNALLLFSSSSCRLCNQREIAKQRKTATAALRVYKTKHDLIKHPFTVPIITRLIAKFESTGSVLDCPGKGRKSMSDERAPIVQNAVEQLQSQSTMASSSITQVSWLTGIPRASVHRIMRRHLHLYPYHFTLSQNITEEDKEQRVTFANWLLDNEEIVPNILRSHEANFSVDGIINKHNCLIWSIMRHPVFALENHYTHRVSWLTGIPRASVHRIMRRHLHLYPYHFTLSQNITEEDKEQRVTFANWLLDNEEIVPNILRSHEANFSVDGIINKHNCLIWSIMRHPVFALENHYTHRVRLTFVFYSRNSKWNLSIFTDHTYRILAAKIRFRLSSTVVTLVNYTHVHTSCFNLPPAIDMNVFCCERPSSSKLLECFIDTVLTKLLDGHSRLLHLFVILQTGAQWKHKLWVRIFHVAISAEVNSLLTCRRT
ncbi:hypothetical protein CLF_101016 [Clonorchis sinensis]|uniref:DUF4817 domain-containing protein n=1 Tax=Clonorchis sinensis TaxID=79923 RepID=G7Y4S6_CLOSI|nr:hypothetical protein CLF_101016 [Clonorchis sinensis]